MFRRHDDGHCFKILCAPAISKLAVVQHLEIEFIDIRVCFFDFIQQNKEYGHEHKMVSCPPSLSEAHH